jgi:hypothetical protein
MEGLWKAIRDTLIFFDLRPHIEDVLRGCQAGGASPHIKDDTVRRRHLQQF